MTAGTEPNAPSKKGSTELLISKTSLPLLTGLFASEPTQCSAPVTQPASHASLKNTRPSPQRPTLPCKPMTNYKCPKCNKQHFLNQCFFFPADGCEGSLGICTKKQPVYCFQPGHRAKKCSRSRICNIDKCGKKHNCGLHFTKAWNAQTTVTVCQALISAIIKGTGFRVTNSGRGQGHHCIHNGWSWKGGLTHQTSLH